MSSSDEEDDNGLENGSSYIGLMDQAGQKIGKKVAASGEGKKFNQKSGKNGEAPPRGRKWAPEPRTPEGFTLLST